MELGTVGRTLLLGLMSSGGSASNPELRDRFGSPLDGKLRLLANAKGLVESEKRGRAYHHTLTDDGWAWCVAELSAAPPGNAGSFGRALYAVLGLLNGYLAAADLSLAEFVTAAQSRGTAGDLTVAIRDAYGKLAREPQEWVLLTGLRPLLGDTPREEVDEALRLMERQPGVHLVPQADQKTLTDEDRVAAVTIGGVAKHLLAIEAP